MVITLIIPVYNEEEAIPLFYSAIRSSAHLKDYSLELLFVDDGSKDNTLKVISELAQEDPKLFYLSFSRNFGKEAALFAGIEHARGDAIIPIDVDLQDPIDVIPLLIEQWKQGAEVVLAKRQDRKLDSFAKRKSAELFYWLLNKISDSPVEENVGDFRLLDKKAVEALKRLPERKLFMKGLFSWVGFKTAVVPYNRASRSAGTSKFHGWKLWNFALEGITSFSTFPLRIWTYIGSSIAFFSFFYALYLLLAKLFAGNPVPGYPSIMVAILFLGGVQLIGIGILGEYIGRIYVETKHRPRYILKEKKTMERGSNDNKGEEEKII